MAKSLQYRVVGSVVIPTPLYVDDDRLAEIILGDEAGHWSAVRRIFERQDMPRARQSVCGLYYVPAVLQFLNHREGLSVSSATLSDDGPDSFGLS